MADEAHLLVSPLGQLAAGPALAQVRALIIEPDPASALTMQAVLANEGCQTRIVTGAIGAKRAALEMQLDLIVTELLLPDGDGLLLCAYLRRHSEAALVICTTHDQPRERTLAYRLGIDDFIAKPYDIDELVVRLEVATRRAAERVSLRATIEAATHEQDASSTFELDGLTLDRTFGEAWYRGARLPLTPTEYRLLSVLMSRVNHTVSREELVALGTGDQYVAGTRGIDMHIRRLRSKLAQTRAENIHVLSVRGEGYRLVALGGASIVRSPNVSSAPNSPSSPDTTSIAGTPDTSNTPSVTGRHSTLPRSA